MSAQDNIQTVKDVYAAFNRGDRDAMTAALAENVEFENREEQVKFHGLEYTTGTRDSWRS